MTDELEDPRVEAPDRTDRAYQDSLARLANSVLDRAKNKMHPSPREVLAEALLDTQFVADTLRAALVKTDAHLQAALYNSSASPSMIMSNPAVLDNAAALECWPERRTE